MRTGSSRILPGALSGLLFLCEITAVCGQSEWWLTDPDQSVLFHKQSANLVFTSTTNAGPTIEVDETKTYQAMIVLNNGREPQSFGISDHGRTATSTLNASAVGTYV